MYVCMYVCMYVYIYIYIERESEREREREIERERERERLVATILLIVRVACHPGLAVLNNRSCYFRLQRVFSQILSVIRLRYHACPWFSVKQ